MTSDENLYSDTLQVERKFYFFDIKQNNEGRFLRITEKKNDRRNSIIIPASGLADFIEKLKDVVDEGLK